jgi:hypothetical protein
MTDSIHLARDYGYWLILHNVDKCLVAQELLPSQEGIGLLTLE